jgi:hypothetical protein
MCIQQCAHMLIFSNRKQISVDGWAKRPIYAYVAVLVILSCHVLRRAVQVCVLGQPVADPVARHPLHWDPAASEKNQVLVSSQHTRQVFDR